MVIVTYHVRVWNMKYLYIFSQKHASIYQTSTQHSKQLGTSVSDDFKLSLCLTTEQKKKLTKLFFRVLKNNLCSVVSIVFLCGVDWLERSQHFRTATSCSIGSFETEDSNGGKKIRMLSISTNVSFWKRAKFVSNEVQHANYLLPEQYKSFIIWLNAWNF